MPIKKVINSRMHRVLERILSMFHRGTRVQVQSSNPLDGVTGAAEVSIKFKLNNT